MSQQNNGEFDSVTLNHFYFIQLPLFLQLKLRMGKKNYTHNTYIFQVPEVDKVAGAEQKEQWPQLAEDQKGLNLINRRESVSSFFIIAYLQTNCHYLYLYLYSIL